MSKTRFTPWVVLACIGTLAGCTSGEGGTAGNTELNVVIPNGAANGSSAPAPFDIQVVEYTINCDATNPGDFPGIDVVEPTFNPDVTISGVLEVLDTASAGVDTQDFGPDLGEVYVWQGFMDIPLDAVCTVQLRARDRDQEVICSATQPFNTQAPFVAGSTVKVNVLMICDLSYQYPVAMLDLDGDFQFNIANFCPDLFVLNCIDYDLDIRNIPGAGTVAATACQVRARDGDSQCGDSCDPQSCVVDTAGLTCTPAPEPPTIAPANNGLKTTVACAPPSFRCAVPGPAFGDPCNPANPDFGNGDCGLPPPNGTTIPAVCAPGAVMDCNGIPNDPSSGQPPFDTSCTYNGDVLGGIGNGAPAPANPGPGGFFVQCILADDDANPSTANVPLDPGATVNCQATTTDGDLDCNKVKPLQLKCPGLSPCQAFIAGGGSCDDANDCTADSCDESSGAAVCVNSAVANGTTCTSAPAPAVCQAGICTSQNCNAQSDPDGSCNDNNECTTDNCEPSGLCSQTPNVGSNCLGGTGTCSNTGVCVDKCVGFVCTEDGNQCTDSVCSSASGAAVCTNVPDDTNTCGPCGGGPCLCAASSCIQGCTVPAPVDAIGIPMACRNSFQVKAVSTFPIDLENITADGCILDGQAVNFALNPTIALDTAFLQAAANTLCDLGTALTSADVTLAQIEVDSVAGATCTEQLSSLTPVPQTVTLDSTVTGTCGGGGSVTINSPVSLALPAVTLPCTAGAAGTDAIQICSTGVVPLAANINLATVPTQTFVGVSVGGGNIQVVFQCNTSSTTRPPPGVQNQVGCNGNATCVTNVGTGNVGQTPFPTSVCDFAGGPPDDPNNTDCGAPGDCNGTCTTVPVGVNPATVCAEFTVQ